MSIMKTMLKNMDDLTKKIADPQFEKPLSYLTLALTSIATALSIAFLPVLQPILWEVTFLTPLGGLVAVGLLSALIVGVYGFVITKNEQPEYQTPLELVHEPQLSLAPRGQMTSQDDVSRMHDLSSTEEHESQKNWANIRNKVLATAVITTAILFFVLPYFSLFLWSVSTFSIGAGFLTMAMKKAIELCYPDAFSRGTSEIKQIITVNYKPDDNPQRVSEATRIHQTGAAPLPYGGIATAPTESNFSLLSGGSWHRVGTIAESVTPFIRRAPPGNDETIVSDTTKSASDTHSH